MSTRDLMNDINPVNAIAPQSVGDGSAVLSVSIDTKGYESATFIMHLGSIADADATWTVTVHEGDTDTQSAHTAVADIDLIGTEVLAGFQFDSDNLTTKIGYKGSKRYISIEIDNVTANTGAALISAICLLGTPHDRPTDNPPALA